MLDIIKKTLLELDNNVKKMTDKMTDKDIKRLQILRNYSKKNEYITNKTLQVLLGISAATARRFLNKLVEDNILKAEGENKSRRYYFIKDKEI